MCGKEGNIYPSGQVPRSLFEFFCDPIKLVERAERIRKYQAFQMNEYIKHLEEEVSDDETMKEYLIHRYFLSVQDSSAF